MFLIQLNDKATTHKLARQSNGKQHTANKIKFLFLEISNRNNST